MKNFNLALIEGRLVSDPEIRYTQGGTALCKFSIANNYAYYRDNELQKEVNFFDVTTWSKLAEQCNEYLKKGRRVIVNGRLRQNRWQDEEGANHSRIDIIGTQVQFLDSRDNGDGTEESSPPSNDEAPF
ncbi:MAG: single-stranded DNA-binding protein [Spirochaetota bacterium]